MDKNIINEPMLEMFIFETLQLIEQLEQIVIVNENLNEFDEKIVNEIFRIMHTIKGSSSMMMFENIAKLSHSIEDLFYYLREESPKSVNYNKLTDIILKCMDFIKIEIDRLKHNEYFNADASMLIVEIVDFLKSLQCIEKSYKAIVYFEEGCMMENMRAFTIVRDLSKIANEIKYIPEDICESDKSEEIIKKQGFEILFKTSLSFDEIECFFYKTPFLKKIEIINNEKLETNKISEKVQLKTNDNIKYSKKENLCNSNKQNVISVNVAKLDKLMDLVGELVISEAMVTENPEIKGLNLNSFYKASRQLKKITSELQNTVMSIRMVPLSLTFEKMNRIIRDMNKKLNKDVVLELIGKETEVDKNIIENINDPLIHLIRNAVDHGIESKEERLDKGKNEQSKITLEAKSSGGDVFITVKDNGRGLDKNKILSKAIKNGILNKSECELTDKELYSYILLPGFSTNSEVTEFSGRGVGMDVVLKNIEKIGGTILIDSIKDEGTEISLKIPLTMAIINGINIAVGNSKYTVPTISIKECFKPNIKDIIVDPDGNEMIMVRGDCFSVIRLHKIFNVKTKVKSIEEGVIIILESGSKTFCILCDYLIGEQEVVVKALPAYIKKTRGIGGCTLLGDGSISLILDVAGLYNINN